MLPHMSIPDGADLTECGYSLIIETPEPEAPPGQKVIPGPPQNVDGVWSSTWIVRPYDLAELAVEQNKMWELIQVKREEVQKGGYKVGDHWFHSDPDSRTQYIALTLLGPNLPSGIEWKTMSGEKVPLTPDLVTGIFQGAVGHDFMVFQVGEGLRAAMMQLADPASFDPNAGWPLTYKESTNGNEV